MTKKSFKQQSNDAVMNFITKPDEIEQDNLDYNAKSEPKDTQLDNSEHLTKVLKKQRVNLFIDADIFEPMNILMDKDRTNITRYINQLIRKDVDSRQDEIEKAKEFFLIK
ncbi:MAG: hypothetical protein ORN24_06165 [Burkholderiales bacterium]|nr:hypothetical protein [Burkholderiales bacterium]